MNQMLGFFMNALRSGGNPGQLMMQFLQNQGTPISSNLMQLAKNGDTKGIEQIARNLCQQKGVDFDSEFRAFRQQFGL